MIGQSDVIPWPAHEWDEILAGKLWLGGHVYEVMHLPFRTKLAGIRLFDHVVSLYEEPDIKSTYPDEDIAHTICEIADRRSGMREDEEADVLGLVELVVEGVELGHKTLIRCQAGYNRSGLVMGMVLVRLGYSAADAIEMMRTKRSAWVLCNSAFEEYLMRYEETRRAQS